MESINFFNVEYLFQQAYELLLGQDLAGLLYLLSGYFFGFLEAIRPLSLLLSLLLIAGIIYINIRHHKVHHKLLELYGIHSEHGHGHGAHGGHHDVHAEDAHGAHHGGESHGHDASHTAHASDPHENKRWKQIVAHIASEEESDWRLAILEADIILDEMLESMGYHGDSVSERLKKVEPSDFTTLDNAWEAHKIRNKIAHEGVMYPLNHREAKRVIALYESVFKEFRFV